MPCAREASSPWAWLAGPASAWPGPWSDGTEQDAGIARQAYFTHPATDALPPLLFNGFPPSTACLVAGLVGFPSVCAARSSAMPLEPLGLGDGLPEPSTPDSQLLSRSCPAPRRSGCCWARSATSRCCSSRCRPLPEGERIRLLRPGPPPGRPEHRHRVAGLPPARASTSSRSWRTPTPACSPRPWPASSSGELPCSAPPSPASRPARSSSEWNGGDAQDAALDGTRLPDSDCLKGTTSVFDPAAGAWTFDLTFAAQAWARLDDPWPTRAILLRPVGAPNLAYGDPDLSTNFIVSLADGKAAEGQRPVRPLPDGSPRRRRRRPTARAAPSDHRPPADSVGERRQRHRPRAGRLRPPRPAATSASGGLQHRLRGGPSCTSTSDPAHVGLGRSCGCLHLLWPGPSPSAARCWPGPLARRRPGALTQLMETAMMMSGELVAGAGGVPVAAACGRSRTPTTPSSEMPDIVVSGRRLRLRRRWLRAAPGYGDRFARAGPFTGHRTALGLRAGTGVRLRQHPQAGAAWGVAAPAAPPGRRWRQPRADPGGSDRTGVADGALTLAVHAPVAGVAPLPSVAFEQVQAASTGATSPRSRARRCWVATTSRCCSGTTSTRPTRAIQACRELADWRPSSWSAAAAPSRSRRAASTPSRPRCRTSRPGVTEAGLQGLHWYLAASMSYAQQADLLAQYVKANFGDAKVGAIVTGTPNFGDAADAWEDAVARQGINYARTLRHPKGSNSWITSYASEPQGRGRRGAVHAHRARRLHPVHPAGRHPGLPARSTSASASARASAPCSGRAAPTSTAASSSRRSPASTGPGPNVPKFFAAGGRSSASPTDDLGFSPVVRWPGSGTGCSSATSGPTAAPT